MSAKPSTVPAWAASGPITVPTSGKQAAGFAAGERGAAQYFDWLFNLNGQWAQYLNDGAMSGDFTFANNVTVVGALRHGPMQRKIPALSGRVFAGVVTIDEFGSMTFTDATVKIVVPLIVNQYEKITAVTGYVNTINAGGITMKVWKVVHGTQTQLGATASATSSANQDLTVSALTETVDFAGAQVEYVAEIISSVANSQLFYGLSVTTDAAP